MKGVDAVANILKREGVEYLFCFPNNSLIDACAKIGIRPILARTERTLINMADGYSRTTHGERLGEAAAKTRSAEWPKPTPTQSRFCCCRVG
jgi:glyoxylate carboligase